MPKARKLQASANDIEAAFYDALARADLTALMALWAEDEEAVCVHPGAGRLIGPASIRASWAAIFERGPVHIRPVQIHATQNSSMAVHNLIEEISRSTELEQELYVIATNVYLKTPHGWRILAHHASIVVGKPPADVTAGAGDTLH
jgi:ketosteroid isomerase-like protein